MTYYDILKKYEGELISYQEEAGNVRLGVGVDVGLNDIGVLKEVHEDCIVIYRAMESIKIFHLSKIYTYIGEGKYVFLNQQ